MNEPVAAVPAAERPAEDRQLRRRMSNPWLLRLFMLRKLPLALVAGLRVRHLDAERCVVTVPCGWRTTNPFRSTYFAALAMAAEMSTGAPAMLAVRNAAASVAMLITGLEAEFVKKATATTVFTCDAGPQMAAAVAEALDTGEPVTVRALSVGRSPEGVEVARFAFTWSFKRR
ncbi:MAG TPA: DUF4442 domain-containing protein [Thermoanaerobaculia bacterium]|nr:DUF4442 domain-containing protein [Thermoanaerobaculia bacterium]